ncbi:MAG TPA: L,D-transpeptidase, partial [Desulfurivibrionaceae bacterium]|nr:L,D-transpeptidase [Desulfurivibrionaceae bacterium]
METNSEIAMQRIRFLTAIVLGCWALLGGCSSPTKVADLSPPPPPRLSEDARYRNPAQHLPLPAVLSDPLIEVHKSKKTLYLFEGDKLWRAYPILVGQNPVDDKV